MSHSVNRSIYFIAGLVGIFFIVIIVRLCYLHYFTDKVTLSSPMLRPIRGAIVDRNGYLLASNVESFSLFAHPSRIEDIGDASRKLSPIIGLNSSWIRNRLSEPKDFVWVKRRLSLDEVNAIERHKPEIEQLGGVGLQRVQRRYYPQYRLASNLVGFVDVDNKGIEGLEFRLDSILSGRSQKSDSEITSEIYGDTVRLTIDRFVQHIAETELENALRQYEAKNGAVVVLEIKTGRILALAKAPGYDPNNFHRYSRDILRHFSITEPYEPGSTMKVLSIAAAIESRPELANAVINCRGAIELADVRITCARPHGTISTAGAIIHSCNVGIIEIMKSVRRSDLHKYLAALGFGRRTGSGIPGESPGILRPERQWSGISKSSISMGYEISVTSLQLAAAYACLANNGIYVEPQIIESIESVDGTVKQPFVPKIKGRVFNENTCSKMLSWMNGVISSGTGREARLQYYQAGGKTGTSRKFSELKKEYTDRLYVSFAGVAPLHDPEICIVVILDDPEESRTGGEGAAPVFASIADKVLPKIGVSSRKVQAGPLQLKENRIPNYTSGIMPNFRGLSLSETISLATEMKKTSNIEVSIIGRGGNVFEQSPRAGERISDTSQIVVVCR